MSRDPIAFRNDPDAPRWVRDAFAREAESRGVAFDADVGLQRLRAAIRAEPPPMPPTGASLATALGSTAVRWTLGVVVVAGAVGIVATTAHRRPVATRAPIGVPSHPSAVVPVPSSVQEPAAELAPAPIAPSRDDLQSPEPPPADPSRSATSGSSHGVPLGNAGPMRTDDALRREMQNLADTRAALVSDPRRALRLATAGQRDFPHGIAADERESMAVLALARLGRRVEARTRGEAFLAAHPHAIFSERIRQVLAESNGGTR